MIRGINFYKYVLQRAAQFANIHFLQDEILGIQHQNEIATVSTGNQQYTADYVFNSIIFQPAVLQSPGSLLQHFKGWMIETPVPAFNESVAVLWILE